MGKAGRRHMLEWLDADRVAKSYEDMYEDATSGH